MAYDEHMAERVRRILNERKVVFEEKKMMGGLTFMVNDKMCCGLLFDKKRNTDLLMARIGENVYEQELSKPGCQPMDFTGRPMKGFVFVTPEGFDDDLMLEHWIDLCLAYNPLAKTSKKARK